MTAAQRNTASNVKSPPEWDPKAVGGRYLGLVREAAEAGRLDPLWVEQVWTHMVHALRTSYTPEEAERAARELDGLLAKWEQYADWKHSQPAAAAAVVEETPPPNSPVERMPWERVRKVAYGVYRFGADFVADMRANRQEVQVRFARSQEEARARRRAAEEALMHATRLPLDGAAMYGSVAPTWIALVMLSWVALGWGALVSAPFMATTVGGATAWIMGILVGAVAVPLWGTFFGFAGMGSARDATLRAMGFKACDESHPLVEKATEFAATLGVKPPQVGLIDHCNAFAMGLDRNDATVAIGQPLMERLTAQETEAVLGHELGHVVSGDMRRMMLMRTFQNATVWYMLAQGLKQFARWVIGWAAELYILAHSRQREYWADAVGAALTSKEAMIGALKKLQDAPRLSSTESTHARFMFRGTLSTHPSFAERIAALEQETYLRRLPRKTTANKQ